MALLPPDTVKKGKKAISLEDIFDDAGQAPNIMINIMSNLTLG